MQLATFEIDVPPRQRPQFRGAQPGEDRRHDQRAKPPLGRGQDRPDLVLGRDIDPDLEALVVALFEAALAGAVLARLLAHHVAGDAAASYRRRQDRAEARCYLFRHNR